ncbi:transcriptional corepressor LEUNIG_HOMOLOG isoform X2 [Gastrolobium bilobum]|uniref:transcriptional corepressor LEUNIG_HOMOLOG isoform X2 n=1 Tax=Gastrolobium bilobum TaxID=150636 RepID=UPI002AB2BA7A|nr:transcriptional corepressor LEUNIG_HOMOLOG isoform X2 [Gastrolobium bilobum]
MRRNILVEGIDTPYPDGLAHQCWSDFYEKLYLLMLQKTDQESSVVKRMQELQVSSSFNKTMGSSTASLLPSTSRMNDTENLRFPQEVGCLDSSKCEVLSCHFSSDGKILASAGFVNQVFIWNMETRDHVTTSSASSHYITDVRFKPGSTIFATSSLEANVKIWDAASRGASNQIRFQPGFGKLLATATGNIINIILFENSAFLFHLKGHIKEVLSICWDESGNYVASVSEDSARVWFVLSGGKCINELHSNGNKFRSCIFHPRYPNLVIVGGHKNLELWIPESKQTMAVLAHNDIIAGLATSPQNGLIATASYDHCVKLWKCSSRASLCSYV